jgi:hypothetical protein
MKQPDLSSRKPSERGSALLIVFVFAAIVAIYLYKELPIAAFEAKREKEQLLIDRGNEYVRAVRLFYRTTRMYPPTIEALENTNRIRFLRRRYVDPFTGKDDWRVLHAAPNGMLLDSKVNPLNPNAQANGNNTSTNSGTGISNGLGTTPAANSGFGGFNSPRGQTMQSGGFGGFGSQSGSGSSSSFGGYFSQPSGPAGGQAGNVPAVPQRPPAIAANGAEGMAVPPAGANAQGETVANPEAPTGAVSPAYIPRTRRPTQADLTANRTGQTMLDTASTPPAEAIAAASQAPEQGGTNAPGSAPATGAATGMTPNGGTGFGANVNTGFGTNVNTGFGANGNTGTGVSSGSGIGGRQTMGVMQSGGIAGVSSKAVGTSIKEVNDQDDYTLWEFYYDPSKDTMRAVMAQAGTQGGNRNGQGQNNPTGFGAGGFGAGPSNAGFGGFNSPGFGNRANTAGGFGSTGSGPGTNSRFGNRNPQGTMSTGSTPP